MGKSTRATVIATGAALAATLAGCGGSAPQTPPSATTSRPPVASPTPRPADGIDAVLIGDSVMRGFALPSTEAWPSVLAARQGITVVNLACDGAGFVAIGTCRERFDGLIPPAAARHPHTVVIQASSNDRGADVEELRTATSQTMTALRDALPDARIIALSTVWNHDPEVPAEITEASAALRSASATVDATFIDVGQPLSGRPDLLQADGIHPTATGQRVLADAIGEALETAGVDLADESY